MVMIPRLILDPLQINVNGSMILSDVSLQVTDLTISSNCYNDLSELDLGQFSFLESIEIGDDCFGSVQTFKIDRLNRLKTIKIGNRSFTLKKNWNPFKLVDIVSVILEATLN